MLESISSDSALLLPSEGMQRRLFATPLSLLLLFTALFTFLIQSGELGTADTTYRLQVTHSLWTGQPQVFPNQYPEFGLHGRNGHIYAWFGIGQSLLMLPADLAGSALKHLPLWQSYVDTQADPAIRSIVVSISTNILLNVLTALVVFRFLELLGFDVRERIAGALSLLLATTHLHYAQNMQENNYIFLLALTGFALQLHWLKTGDRRGLFWGSFALGLNLLTRLTTGLDLMAAGLFLALTGMLIPLHTKGSKTHRWYMNSDGSGPLAPEFRPSLEKTLVYIKTALPVYLSFFFIDRLYQWIRFGSWTNTYVTIFAREERQIDPSLPLKYPFSGHFFAGGLTSGMIGPFFAPEKSVFLFDPLFGFTLLVAVLFWKRFTPLVRAFIVTAFTLVLAYLLFYARYFSWPGDFAWGDRYASSAIEFSTLLTWPLLLRYWKTLGKGVRGLAIVVTSASVVVQLASIAYWVPLEIYQEETLGHPTWVILLRFKNILARALGKSAAWAMTSQDRFPAMYQDPWDAQHITTWYFLPSLLRHIGVAPMWAIHVLYAVWIVVGATMVVVGVRLLRSLDGLSDGKHSVPGNPTVVDDGLQQ